MSNNRVVIHSYRRVFNVDRRIYRIDQWTLPVPGGVPLRGLVYFAASLVSVIVLSHFPGIGALVNVLAPPFRYLILPLAVAVFAMQVTPDGRTMGRYAVSWVLKRVRARRTSAGREVPPERALTPWAQKLRVGWDSDSPQLRHGKVTGPVRVTFRTGVHLKGGRVLRARPTHDDSGESQVVVMPGEKMVIKP